MLLFDLLRGKIGGNEIKEIIKWGATSSILSLIVSIPIDTYFWGLQYDIRYRGDSKQLFVMWPEMHSFYFNGVQNKSHEWGVSPWHWYFLNALPRSVTCALPFFFIGLFYQPRKTLMGFLDTQTVQIIGPALIFIGIFSVLPHKELRFIMPALTLFNIAGAYGLSKM